MIRELLAGHGPTVWPVVFLLGCLAAYLTVVLLVWLRPGAASDLDQVAALPLAADTGNDHELEGREA